MIRNCSMHWLLAALAVGIAGCSQPRSTTEIEADMRKLPALYLTAKSNKQVQAASDAGLFVDSATGELCYPAYECIRPDCPARVAGSNPVIFMHTDGLASVGPGGEIQWKEPPLGGDLEKFILSLGGQMEPTCPHCLKGRDLASETTARKEEFRRWVRPYVLPETLSKQQELEAEYQTAYAKLQQRRQGVE